MKKSFWLILFSFCLSMSINAQVFTNPIPPQINMQNQIWRNFRMGQIGNQMAADMARSNQAKKSSAKSNSKSNSIPQPNAKVSPLPVYQKQFSFIRSGNSVLAQKIAEGNSSINLNQMNQLVDYLWKDYETSFRDENQRLGMPFNDTVAAMTYYIIINYLSANGLPSLESEKSVAVYKQVAEVFAKDAELSRLQSNDKRLLAEVLVAMGGMPALSYKQSKNRSELKKMALENLARIFGPNAGNLKITENGLEF